MGYILIGLLFQIEENRHLYLLLFYFFFFLQKLVEAIKVGFDSAVGGSFSAMPQTISRIFSLMGDSKEDEAKVVQQELVEQLNVIFRQSNVSSFFY